MLINTVLIYFSHKDILETLEESNFAKIISTNSKDDFVYQRIDALRKFKASNAQYALFLNSSVIIHNSNTLKTLVKQDENIVAPMIRKNVFLPSLKQRCHTIGYKPTGSGFGLKFPTVIPYSTWTNDRYYVCYDFITFL